MRSLIVAALIMGLAGSATAQDRQPRGPLFISPMGEPFRGTGDGPAPHDQWFDGADANHDGALTSAEMVADATRFFDTLDLRKDGEIDPQDMERYEAVLVPEVHGGEANGRDPSVRLKGDGTGLRNDNGFGSPPVRSLSYRERTGKQGAARFGYLDYPQPITVADRNFNRGVDLREFTRAAETRFDMLDRNHDRRIEKSELPRL